MKSTNSLPAFVSTSTTPSGTTPTHNRIASKRARFLIEARAAIAGDKSITWTNWVAENVKRSLRDVQSVMKIARASDPKAALQKERETKREGMRKTREATTWVAPQTT